MKSIEKVIFNFKLEKYIIYGRMNYQIVFYFFKSIKNCL